MACLSRAKLPVVTVPLPIALSPCAWISFNVGDLGASANCLGPVALLGVPRGCLGVRGVGSLSRGEGLGLRLALRSSLWP